MAWFIVPSLSLFPPLSPPPSLLLINARPIISVAGWKRGQTNHIARRMRTRADGACRHYTNTACVSHKPQTSGKEVLTVDEWRQLLSPGRLRFRWRVVVVGLGGGAGAGGGGGLGEGSLAGWTDADDLSCLFSNFAWSFMTLPCEYWWNSGPSFWTPDIGLTLVV